MNLKQALRITKKILNDYANQPEPARVEIVTIGPDGNMSQDAQIRVATNAGGLNIIMDAYMEKTPLKPIGTDADSD